MANCKHEKKAIYSKMVAGDMSALTKNIVMTPPPVLSESHVTSPSQGLSSSEEGAPGKEPGNEVG